MAQMHAINGRPTWPVVTFGHPGLRCACKEAHVSPTAMPLLRAQADDLIATMDAYQGVGIAANQIGQRRAMCVIAPPGKAPVVLINPTLSDPSADEATEIEGCLSLPDAPFHVTRPKSVDVHAWTLDGERTWRAHGYEARVVQHEVDHLAGLTILDRAPDEERERFYRRLRGGGSVETARLPDVLALAMPSLAESARDHPAVWGRIAV